MLVTGLVRLFLIGLVASFWLSIWLSQVAVAVEKLIVQPTAVVAVARVVSWLVRFL
jgi:hypothetical protein